MAKKTEVLKLEMRYDFNSENPNHFVLKPTLNFVPSVIRNSTAGSQTLAITRRNNHAIMFRRLDPNSMVREIGFPANCEMCYHQEGIEEIMEDGQWWWYCPECKHKWDPIKALD